eukprot:m.357127 g.357127  ORF g.357127 m.357127 type:complete len:216 (-) comp55966_c0_seq2:163-810(-)
MAVNPWSSGSSWSPALALAAAHGIITDQERQACFVLPDEHDSSSPLEDGGSVLLTRRLRETSALAETLDATLSELQRSYLLCNTHLFTEPHQISRKIDMLREYSAHLSAVQSNKQLLTARIQRNMQKGALNIEAKHHKAVVEVFPALARSITDINNQIELLEWAKSATIKNDAIISALRATSSRLAQLQRQYDALIKVRDATAKLMRASTAGQQA